MPVLSRSVRVEPKVETRVDSGVKETEFVQRRVVEEDRGLEFCGGGGGKGSVRRKWEGRNTVVYDSGLKEKDGDRGLRVVKDVEFGGRKVYEFGAKEREVVEEESVELGGGRGRKVNAFVSDNGVKEKEGVVIDRSEDRRGRKANAFVSDSGVKKEKEKVVTERLADRRGRKANAFVSDSGVKENEGGTVVEEGNGEFRDERDQKSNDFVSDYRVKEKEVVRGQSVSKEGVLGFREGKGMGVKLEKNNVMVLDSSPKLLYDASRQTE